MLFASLCTLVSDRLPATPLRAWASTSAVARSPAADVGHVGVVEEQFGQFEVQRFVAFEAVDDVLVIYFGVLQRGNVFFVHCASLGFGRVRPWKYNPGHDES